MNKQEMIKAIATKTGLTQVDTAKVLNSLEEITYEEVGAGRKVQLTGFVIIQPAARAARKGFDPIKKVPMDIDPTVGVKVSAGEKLKKVTADLKYEDFKKVSAKEAAKEATGE